MTASPAPLSSLLRRQLALDALCDERTLKRALRGKPIKALCKERIVRALSARGLLHLLPSQPNGECR